MANALMRFLLFAGIFLGGVAAAHATIVFGELSAEPSAPDVGEPFTLTLTMYDPTEVPVEDAYVLADFSFGEETTEYEFEEQSPGVYQTEAVLPEAGEYTLTMRDQTFRQEEATTQVGTKIPGTEFFPDDLGSFLFPPTVTNSSSVTTWLIWLIALPVAVGVIVTILVLRKPKETEAT